VRFAIKKLLYSKIKSRQDLRVSEGLRGQESVG
jgi:hypothetical protein